MTAKQEAETLMNDLLPFGKRMLSEHGEFLPFGGYTKRDGSIVHVGAKVEGTDKPKSADLVRITKDALLDLSRRNECKATAIVFNVAIEQGDAIQVNVDHEDGYSAEVFFPYHIDGQNVVYGKVFAQEGDYLIFGKKDDGKQ